MLFQKWLGGINVLKYPLNTVLIRSLILKFSSIKFPRFQQHIRHRNMNTEEISGGIKHRSESVSRYVETHPPFPVACWPLCTFHPYKHGNQRLKNLQSKTLHKTSEILVWNPGESRVKFTQFWNKPFFLHVICQGLFWSGGERFE